MERDARREIRGDGRREIAENEIRKIAGDETLDEIREIA